MIKKRTKSILWTIGTIIGVLIISVLAINKPAPETDMETIKCIGQNSILYVQAGCSHCITQEKLFGDNLNLINSIDCIYEREKCSNILATPTWVIDGQQYKGVQSIEKLKELTTC